MLPSPTLLTGIGTRGSRPGLTHVELLVSFVRQMESSSLRLCSYVKARQRTDMSELAGALKQVLQNRYSDLQGLPPDNDEPNCRKLRSALGINHQRSSSRPLKPIQF